MVHMSCACSQSGKAPKKAGKKRKASGAKPKHRKKGGSKIPKKYRPCVAREMKGVRATGETRKKIRANVLAHCKQDVD